MPHHYPMRVDLQGRRCLLVGGGRVAERKVSGLLTCEARVDVVSPTATARLEGLAATGAIRLARRPVRSGDLVGSFLVVVATDDREVNRRIAAEVRAAGVLVNVADDPGACTFLVPAVLRRGDLTLAISTGGGSPALAKKLRQRLEQTIGPEYEAFLAALRGLRARAQETIADPEERQALYRRALESDLFEHVVRGDRAAAAARIDELVQTAAHAGRR